MTEPETTSRRCYRDAWQDVSVTFAGKGYPADRQDAVRRLGPDGVDTSWLKQIHSDRVCRAQPGLSGSGDALISDQRGLALSIVTADCVPVLLANEHEIAAVHAGWRGIAAKIIGQTLARFEARPTVAWIGPAIGLGAYEVGPDVAQQVVAASVADVMRQQSATGRPHVDLRAAADFQLRAGGLEDIRTLGPCTFDSPEDWWSYRREGPKAGRNHAVIWRSS